MGGTRKPAEHDPANPFPGSPTHRSSGAVGPPARVFWCYRHPAPTPALQCLKVYEHLQTGCEHEAIAHCPACAAPHIWDLMLTLGGETHPGPR